MGEKDSVADCAEAVMDAGGRFFIYGKDEKSGRCYMESTESGACPEGWEEDFYDFYEAGVGSAPGDERKGEGETGGAGPVQPRNGGEVLPTIKTSVYRSGTCEGTPAVVTYYNPCVYWEHECYNEPNGQYIGSPSKVFKLYHRKTCNSTHVYWATFSDAQCTQPTTVQALYCVPGEGPHLHDWSYTGFQRANKLGCSFGTLGQASLVRGFGTYPMGGFLSPVPAMHPDGTPLQEYWPAEFHFSEMVECAVDNPTAAVKLYYDDQCTETEETDAGLSSITLDPAGCHNTDLHSTCQCGNDNCTEFVDCYWQEGSYEVDVKDNLSMGNWHSLDCKGNMSWPDWTGGQLIEVASSGGGQGFCLKEDRSSFSGFWFKYLPPAEKTPDSGESSDSVESFSADSYVEPELELDYFEVYYYDPDLPSKLGDCVGQCQAIQQITISDAPDAEEIEQVSKTVLEGLEAEKAEKANISGITALESSKTLSTLAKNSIATGGLSEDEGKKLLSTVDDILVNTDVDSITRKDQKEISVQVLQAATDTADAVAEKMLEDEEIELPAKNGLKVTVAKQSAATLAVSGYKSKDGQVQLPAISPKTGSTKPISVQTTQWPENPFAFAGARTAGTGEKGKLKEILGPPPPPPPPGEGYITEKKAECCTIIEDSVKSITLRQAQNDVKVKDLETPVVFKIKAERVENTIIREDADDMDGIAYVERITESKRLCQFWDEFAVPRPRWSTEGCTVLRDQSTDDEIVCSCTHLTSFGGSLGTFTRSVGIPDEYIAALVCSQATLLDGEGFQAVGDGFGRWQLWLLFLIVVTLVSLQVVAAYLDYSRGSVGKWSDEDFVLMSIEGASVLEQGKSFLEAIKNFIGCGGKTEEEKTHVFKVAPGPLNLLHDPETGRVRMVHEGWANRNGIQVGWKIHEVEGQPFSNQLFTELSSGTQDYTVAFMEEEPPKKSMKVMVEGFLLGQVASGIEQLHCMRSGHLHEDIVKLAALDKQVSKEAEKIAWGPEAEQKDDAFGSQSEKPSLKRSTSQGSEVFDGTRTKITAQFTEVNNGFDQELELIESQGQYGVLSLCWIFFLTSTPLAAALRFSMFLTASMRVLLLALDIFGVLLAGALFFQGTGSALDKDSPAECSDDGGLVGSIPYVVMTTILSKLVAKGTLWIVALIQARKFVEIDENTDVPLEVAKKKAVFKWRIADGVTVVLSSLLIIFSTIFCTVFVSNVSDEDANKWFLMAFLSFLSTLILTPLVISLFSAVLTYLVVKKNVLVGRDAKEEALQEKSLGRQVNIIKGSNKAQLKAADKKADAKFNQIVPVTPESQMMGNERSVEPSADSPNGPALVKADLLLESPPASPSVPMNNDAR
jgi:hypothetical protein